MITAKEARELIPPFKITKKLIKIEKRIKEAALNGKNTLYVNNLSNNEIEYLEKHGYKYTVDIDYICIDIDTFISW